MKSRLLLALSSLVFTAIVSAEDVAFDCNNAVNTLQINGCASIERDSAKEELSKYLDASFEHNSYDPELVKAIKVAQNDWQAYMSSHCDSIYTQWREGTIRGVMYISCETKLTKQRTHEVWANFLTYMDSTPPVLPEPKQ
ncbi:lysozyme inhibitor LprI family protein [Vibrio gallaecicus]|uniref:lysozyme inhibitor LprI family protein n=1 Tax=Vibrio gallaecicus TaxID=552386 RepID=UPI0010CA0F35|nr:lysozyme inhibitor LprI family protein [Vibrio gallaecicus]MDN3617205.1 lysozyme inhibitor LprI family protein [Vibrio gallaecicus]